MSTRNQSQTSSNIVWRNAPTAYVDVGGTRFAYRAGFKRLSIR